MKSLTVLNIPTPSSSNGLRDEMVLAVREVLVKPLTPSEMNENSL